MSKKQTVKRGNPGNIKKEPTEYKKDNSCYNYQLGDNYQIELKANMIYYKKKDTFNNYNLVKAEMTPNNSYGSHELRVHAIEVASKMDLILRESISGSIIPTNEVSESTDQSDNC